MRASLPIVALLVSAPVLMSAQTPVWHLDVGTTTLVEAWNFNETKEALAGLEVGVDRQVWRAVFFRFEGMLLRVRQPSGDAWLRGFTIGGRARKVGERFHPFAELAVGASHATAPVPVRGTGFNYLIVASAGTGIPIRESLALDLAARWFHVSNNGRAGRTRNPDIQALGMVVAVRWSY
jgi:hypothetical protein